MTQHHPEKLDDLEREQARLIVWSWPHGAEYLRLTHNSHRQLAEGTVVDISNDQPLRFSYSLSFDHGWRLRTASFEAISSSLIRLRSDGQGRWEDALGTPLPDIEGCLDLIIAGSTFAMTPLILRSGLVPGGKYETTLISLDPSEPGLHAQDCCLTRGSASENDLYSCKIGLNALQWRVDAENYILDLADGPRYTRAIQITDTRPRKTYEGDTQVVRDALRHQGIEQARQRLEAIRADRRITDQRASKRLGNSSYYRRGCALLCFLIALYGALIYLDPAVKILPNWLIP